jgi:23S rRNA pseudouridine1911/1915/1917 synthase
MSGMSHQSQPVPASIPAPARQLSSVLQNLFKIPKSQIEPLLVGGNVTVNGKIKRQSYWKLEVGDTVEVDWVPQPILAPSHTAKAKSSSRAIEFLFDDADIVVVNKPANLLTVPTKHREPHTLVSLVEKNLRRRDPEASVFCVHRLDRGVSGVLVLAKSLEMAEALRDQFADRKPNRKYVTLVSGIPKQAQACLRNYLSTDKDLNRIIVRSENEGELAITHYQRKQSWRDAAMLEVRLETGRRNQIRVQLAEIGHPILGDPRYRPRQAEHWGWPYHRIALHAQTLGFRHPRTQEPVEMETQWPQEFRDFIRHQKRQNHPS